MNMKQSSDFKSRGPKNGKDINVKWKHVAVAAGVLFTIMGGIIKHEDRYAKSDEVHEIKKEVKEITEIQKQYAQDIAVIKTVQKRIEKGQDKILDKLDEISR